MAPFDFKSNKHFVASSDGANLQVYELTKPTLYHPSSIRKSHWREVANINDDDDDDDDDMVDQTKKYDGLLFFDGHGKIEGRVALTKLAQHLKRLSLMVGPGGLCFQDVNETGEYADFGIHYLRLNDLFSWPRHGVDLATTITWGRSELKYHDPRHVERSKQTEGGNTVTMEMHEQLKRLVKEKNEELAQLKEEADDELQNLREEKEDELREEIAKLNEAKNEELLKLRKEKDEELRELSKKKNVELRILRKGQGGGAALQKLREEKEEEVRKLRNESEKDMQKLRDQLSSSATELTSVKQALGVYVNSSSVLSPGGRVLRDSSFEELWRYHVGRRRPVPPGIFHVTHRDDFFARQDWKSYVPTFTEREYSGGYLEAYNLVNDDTTKELPAPPIVHVITAGEAEFDVNNWWYEKTTHPEGGTTMLAYYDGDRNRFQHHSKGTIRIPYSKGARYCLARNFYLGYLCGKIVFCFRYRN